MSSIYGTDIYAGGTDFEAIKPKIDVCLVVDRSDSLRAAGVDSIINEGLQNMLTALKNDPYLSGFDVFLTVVSFANDMTKNVDFVLVKDVKPNALTLTFGGQTNPGPALAYTIEKAYNRYRQWRDDGDEAYHPLLFYFTDGYPGPDKNFKRDYEETAKKIKELAEKKKVLAVGAGFGKDANIDNLSKMTLTPEYVIKMNESNVEKLGEFFSKIIHKTTVEATKPTQTSEQFVDMFRDFSNK